MSKKMDRLNVSSGLPGQYYDAETGNWNNGFRDYASQIGRYLQSDQIGLAGGINTYAYVRNTPIVRVDSWGLLDTNTLIGQYMIHYYQNVFNHTPANEAAAAAPGSGWARMSQFNSSFHQYGPDGGLNSKWVSKSGHCEAVYDGNGSLITDNINGGTYNYSSPDADPIGHIFQDVIPYLQWGNGPTIVSPGGN